MLRSIYYSDQGISRKTRTRASSTSQLGDKHADKSPGAYSTTTSPNRTWSLPAHYWIGSFLSVSFPYHFPIHLLHTHPSLFISLWPPGFGFGMCRQTKPKPKTTTSLPSPPFPYHANSRSQAEIVSCIRTMNTRAFTCGRRSRQGTNTGRYKYTRLLYDDGLATYGQILN